MGSIELTIADEAWNIALRIAYGNSLFFHYSVPSLPVSPSPSLPSET